jgi:hypothetical protein
MTASCVNSGRDSDLTKIPSPPVGSNGIPHVLGPNKLLCSGIQDRRRPIKSTMAFEGSPTRKQEEIA